MALAIGVIARSQGSGQGAAETALRHPLWGGSHGEGLQCACAGTHEVTAQLPARSISVLSDKNSVQNKTGTSIGQFKGKSRPTSIAAASLGEVQPLQRLLGQTSIMNRVLIRIPESRR